MKVFLSRPKVHFIQALNYSFSILCCLSHPNISAPYNINPLNTQSNNFTLTFKFSQFFFSPTLSQYIQRICRLFYFTLICPFLLLLLHKLFPKYFHSLSISLCSFSYFELHFLLLFKTPLFTLDLRPTSVFYLTYF